MVITSNSEKNNRPKYKWLDSELSHHEVRDVVELFLYVHNKHFWHLESVFLDKIVNDSSSIIFLHRIWFWGSFINKVWSFEADQDPIILIHLVKLASAFYTITIDCNRNKFGVPASVGIFENFQRETSARTACTLIRYPRKLPVIVA